MSAGGIRESTHPAVLRPIDFGEPSSYHSGSKRNTMDNVVDSPEKKKTCSVGEYMARLSESIAARSTSHDMRVKKKADDDASFPRPPSG